MHVGISGNLQQHGLLCGPSLNWMCAWKWRWLKSDIAHITHQSNADCSRTTWEKHCQPSSEACMRVSTRFFFLSSCKLNLLSHVEICYHMLRFVVTIWDLLLQAEICYQKLKFIITSGNLLLQVEMFYQMLRFIITKWDLLSNVEICYHILKFVITCWHLSYVEICYHIFGFVTSWHLISNVNICRQVLI